MNCTSCAVFSNLSDQSALEIRVRIYI